MAYYGLLNGGMAQKDIAPVCYCSAIKSGHIKNHKWATFSKEWPQKLQPAKKRK
jgi:hypothetical protein